MHFLGLALGHDSTVPEFKELALADDDVLRTVGLNAALVGAGEAEVLEMQKALGREIERLVFARSVEDHLIDVGASPDDRLPLFTAFLQTDGTDIRSWLQQHDVA